MTTEREVQPFYRKSTWQGRPCYVLGNQRVCITALMGGGHIADMHILDADGRAGVNPLWQPPWRTIEPYEYKEKIHSSSYGSLVEGKLLSGLAGHSICLDYFGLPSAEEVAQGLSLHGEAPSSLWRLLRAGAQSEAASIELLVQLPIAGLEFTRRMEVRSQEPVVYFEETVRNRRKADHFFHWTQHVTLGAPFLDPRYARTFISGDHGITSPDGYDEGRAVLRSNQKFRWPHAPKVNGGDVDLTRPFVKKGFGFVVTVRNNPRRKVSFVAALNQKLALLIAYCFRTSDYPWTAVWEENMAISAPPWKRRTQARGLEFSSTALPLPRRRSFLGGPLYNTPNLACVPAMGERKVQYIAVLAEVPRNFGHLRDIVVEGGGIRLKGNEKSMFIPSSASEQMVS